MTMGFYVPTNKDVKFPKACEQCYFYDGLLCCVLDTYIHDSENKQEDCPLVPIPPHGRLIDEDVLIKTAHNQWPLPIDFLKLLELVPTVIPADGEDTNVTTRKEGK